MPTMTTNPYQVLGASVPPMLGRAPLVRRIERHLLKPTPDHVSIVGPQYYGKSVLLRRLADMHRTGSSHFLTTTHVDLRHGTPATDEEFMQRFGQALEHALRTIGAEVADWIDSDGGALHDSLALVFEELENARQRVLVVLDGFDYVLASSGLTRNLWDQLRTLAQRTSLRLTTGSRRPLRELCTTEESRTSDFWEIFHPEPVRVGALEDADWPAFLGPLRESGCEIDASAEKEIANWTGGVPVFVCALLQSLWDERRGASAAKQQVDQVAERLLGEGRELLAAMWDDCDDELRTDIASMSARDLAVGKIPEARRRELGQRGFGRVSGSRLRGSCRLIQRYAAAQAPAMADVKRLFGTASGFDANIRYLLELRLKLAAQSELDEDLYRYVGHAVQHVTTPEDAFIWVRSIADRALTLIWDAELPRNRTLPAEWLDEWRQAGVNFSVDQESRLPRPAGAQCSILRLVTGTRSTRRRSKYVTKGTYLLVDYLQSVGDFGQHRAEFREVEVSIGFAASVLLSAIALLESLAHDLQDADEP